VEEEGYSVASVLDFNKAEEIQNTDRVNLRRFLVIIHMMIMMMVMIVR
jgi:hypothetical protein